MGVGPSARAEPGGDQQGEELHITLTRGIRRPSEDHAASHEELPPGNCSALDLPPPPVHHGFPALLVESNAKGMITELAMEEARSSFSASQTRTSAEGSPESSQIAEPGGHQRGAEPGADAPQSAEPGRGSQIAEHIGSGSNVAEQGGESEVEGFEGAAQGHG